MLTPSAIRDWRAFLIISWLPSLFTEKCETIYGLTPMFPASRFPPHRTAIIYIQIEPSCKPPSAFVPFGGTTVRLQIEAPAVLIFQLQRCQPCGFSEIICCATALLEYHPK